MSNSKQSLLATTLRALNSALSLDDIYAVFEGAFSYRDAVNRATAELNNIADSFRNSQKARDAYALIKTFRTAPWDAQEAFFNDARNSDVRDLVAQNGKEYENIQQKASEEVLANGREVFAALSEVIDSYSEIEKENKKIMEFSNEISKAKNELSKKKREEIYRRLEGYDFINYFTRRQVEDEVSKLEPFATESHRLNAMTTEMTEQKARLLASKEAFCSRLQEKLLSLSRVSETEAREWAKNVPVDDGTKQFIERSSLSMEQFYTSLATVYRLCNGKLKKLSFVAPAPKTNRSYAYEFTIALANGNVSALFHEMGHIYEHQCEMDAIAAKGFLKQRATGEPIPLNSFPGLIGYDADEIAYPDKFYAPYVGKVYPGLTSSEVLSMGIEMVSAGQEAENIFKDPEHFQFTLGCLFSEHSETFVPHQGSPQTLGQKFLSAQKKEDAWEAALNDVLARTSFAERIYSQKGVEGYRATQVSTQSGREEAVLKQGRRVVAALYRGKENNALYYLYICYEKKLLPAPQLPLIITYKKKKYFMASITKCPDWFTHTTVLPEI